MKNQANTAFMMAALSILVWSFAGAVARGLAEGLGTFTSGALPNFLGALVLMIYKAKTVGLKGFRDTPRGYWLGCGLTFVSFSVFVTLSIGLAQTREQVVISGLFRMIWPLLALILSIPLQKKRVKKWFIASAAISFVGMALASFADGLSPGAFTGNLSILWLVSFLSLLSSIAWALYSIFVGKYVANPAHNHLWILLLATGVIQIALAAAFGETPRFAVYQLGGILYLGVLAGFIVNLSWIRVMQGPYSHTALLFFNFLPIFSTVAVGLTLGVRLTLPLMIGAVLVAVGTFWSRRCFVGD